MLHVRLIVPAAQADDVVSLLDDPTVVNLVVVDGASRRPEGDLILFDVARESASRVLEELRDLGLHHTGSISFDESQTMLSDAAEHAERVAPGQPDDAVLWEEIEVKSADNSRLSWSFVAFLVLATLIAGIGRYLDQPILIVGAMVVGPEFAAVSAICFGLARLNVRLAATALRTLCVGFGIAIAIAIVFWWCADLFGWIESEGAGTGPQTKFVVQPDWWSFVIALLAGVAGVLSLTAAKSATLVGVFISVVTVPAAGAVGLTIATGLGTEAWHALAQLLLNIGGMVLSGTLTLVVQRLVWRRIDLPSETRRSMRTRSTSVTDSRR